MVLENTDGATEKKTRYTLSCLTNGISNTRLLALAANLNALRTAPYTSLYKIVDSEIN